MEREREKERERERERDPPGDRYYQKKWQGPCLQ